MKEVIIWALPTNFSSTFAFQNNLSFAIDMKFSMCFIMLFLFLVKKVLQNNASSLDETIFFDMNKNCGNLMRNLEDKIWLHKSIENAIIWIVQIHMYSLSVRDFLLHSVRSIGVPLTHKSQCLATLALFLCNCVTSIFISEHMFFFYYCNLYCFFVKWI